MVSKTLISVPGFNSTIKKKYAFDKDCQAMEEGAFDKDCQAMKEEIVAQPHHPTPTTVPEKGSKMEDRFKKGVNRHSLHNGNNASIAINAVIPIIMQARKSVINGLPKESNNAENVIAGGINMSEVTERALSVDGEPVTRERIKQKKPHVTARVSLHAKRILLSWIRRSRPGTPTLKTATTKSIGKKRVCELK